MTKRSWPALTSVIFAMLILASCENKVMLTETKATELLADHYHVTPDDIKILTFHFNKQTADYTLSYQVKLDKYWEPFEGFYMANVTWRKKTGYEVDIFHF